MNLSDVLKNEKRHSHELALEGVFGDAFLLTESQTFRQVRKRATQFGFCYTDRAFSDYQLNPTFYLSEILNSRQIPFVRNRGTLEKIAESLSEPMLWSQVELPIGNKLLHESSHCVAAEVLGLKGNLKFLQDRPLDQQQIWVFRYLLAESFANACEMYSATESDLELSMYVLKLNNYLFDKDLPKISKLFKSLRTNRRFNIRLLVFSYLLCNYGFLFIGRKFFEKFSDRLLCDGYEVEPDKEPLLYEVVRSVGGLNNRFVIKTNPFFFKVLGLNQSYSKLIDIDFVSLFFDQNYERSNIEALLDLIDEREISDGM